MIKVANNLNVLFEKRSAISDYLNNDYVRYGGGGALAGAGLGALVNKLMGGSALKGGLLGAGLGAGAGLGYKGLSDYQAKQRSNKADESMTSVEGTRASRTPEELQAARDSTAKIHQLDPDAPKNWLTPRETRQERTLALGGIDTESLMEKQKQRPFNFAEDAQKFTESEAQRAGLEYLYNLVDYGNALEREQRSNKADESMTSVEDIRARGSAERTQRARDEAAAAKQRSDKADESMTSVENIRARGAAERIEAAAAAAKQRSDKADESMTSVENIRARGSAERTQRARDEAAAKQRSDKADESMTSVENIRARGAAERIEAAAKAKKDIEDRAAIARGQRVGNFVPSLPTPQADQEFVFNDQVDLDPMARMLRVEQLLRKREQERMRDAVDPASIERVLRGVLNPQPSDMRIRF